MRTETSPEDIQGMYSARGILTGARRHDKPRRSRRARNGTAAVLRAATRYSSTKRKSFSGRLKTEFSARATLFRWNGSTGYVYGEEIPTVPASITGNFDTIMQWSDEFRTLGVRTNADTPKDAVTAREIRGGRHRPLPYRAHVLRCGTHCLCAADDRIGQRAPAQSGA